MLKLISFDNKDIYFPKDKIIAIAERLNKNETSVFIKCDIASEEWVINLPIEQVLNAYELEGYSNVREND
jgi:hypothetical protein